MASWKELILSGSQAHLHSVTASNAVPMKAINVSHSAYSKSSTSLAIWENDTGNLLRGNSSFIDEMLFQNSSSLQQYADKPFNYRRYFGSGSSILTSDSINLSGLYNCVVDVFLNSNYVTFGTIFLDTGSLYYNSSGSNGTNSGSIHHFNIINASLNTGSMFFRPGDVCPDSYLTLPPNTTTSFKVWRGDYILSHKTPPYTTVKTFWLPYGQQIKPY